MVGMLSIKIIITMIIITLFWDGDDNGDFILFLDSEVKGRRSVQRENP